MISCRPTWPESAHACRQPIVDSLRSVILDGAGPSRRHQGSCSDGRLAGCCWQAWPRLRLSSPTSFYSGVRHRADAEAGDGWISSEVRQESSDYRHLLDTPRRRAARVAPESAQAGHKSRSNGATNRSDRTNSLMGVKASQTDN